MAKDPAFLFYYQDFAYGTRKMTFEEKGGYIELLCEQADFGHLSLNDIKRALKESFHIWTNICDKFTQDDNGLYYDKILEEHLDKRRKFTESRRRNLMGKHKDKHKEPHMENRNVNGIENKDEKKEGVYKGEDVQKLWNSTFGRSPTLPEQDETQKLIEKFGYDKTYEIMYQANLDGFKKIKTLTLALDDNGNIKPRESGKENRAKNSLMGNCAYCSKETTMQFGNGKNKKFFCCYDHSIKYNEENRRRSGDSLQLNENHTLQQFLQ
jgi:hypothetical protein